MPQLLRVFGFACSVALLPATARATCEAPSSCLCASLPDKHLALGRIGKRGDPDITEVELLQRFPIPLPKPCNDTVLRGVDPSCAVTMIPRAANVSASLVVIVAALLALTPRSRARSRSRRAASRDSDNS